MRRRVLLAITSALALAGCGEPAASTPEQTSVTVATRAGTPARPPAPAPSTVPVVVLDPGHNGGNAANPGAINRPVPAGRGRTKPCNTTGTATNAGFPEHKFTWSVSLLVRKILAAQGIKVLLTRQTDDGVGPCVNERAALGNRAKADAVVSIHADGSPAAAARGFHIAYSAPPLNAAQGEPSQRLARVLRDTMRAKFPVSTYLGDEGLTPRDDLGGLNLSTRPAVLVECGNMRNAAEAAAFASKAGQRSYAEAIAAGVVAYLR